MHVPQHRFLERETKLGGDILARVRGDLTEISEICQGRQKQTNHHREVGMLLVRGVIPASWKRFTTPSSLTVASWIANFGQRVAQLGQIIETSRGGGGGGGGGLRSFDYWLGGLFNPEAFITATRQCVAQANSWSLEDLTLRLIVDGSDGGGGGASSFCLKNVVLHGAVCEPGGGGGDNCLSLGRSAVTELKTVRLLWKGAQEVQQERRKASITLPVYLNSDRSEILVNVDFALGKGQEERFFLETGVAFLANA